MSSTARRRTGLPVVAGSALLIAAIGLSAWHLRDTAADDALAGATATLASALSTQQALDAARVRELGLIARQLADDKSFVGYVAHARGGDGGSASVADTASIRDLLDEQRDRAGFDVALILDMTSRVIVDASLFQRRSAEVLRNPAVSDAISELQAHAGHIVDRGRAAQVVATPMQLGATSEGIIVTGFVLDDTYAKRVGDIARSDIAYIANQAEGPQVIAATLVPTAREALARIATERRWLDRALPFDGRAFMLDGREWLANIDAESSGAIRTVALVPAPAPSAAFERALWIGAIAVAAIALLSLLLVWLTVLRPLARLARSAEPIAGGTLEPIKVNDGATRTIATALNRLSGELRESRDFETYAAEILRQRRRGPENSARTEPVPAVDHGAAAGREPGSVLAERYEIYGRIGAGQSGVVYRALDRRQEEIVALKLIGPATLRDPEQITQMRMLLRGGMRVAHTAITRIRDVGQDGASIYVAYEFVRGVTLKLALERTGRVPLYAGLRIARRLCAGVAAIHAAGTSHGTLSTSNVTIEPGLDIRITDLGLLAPRLGLTRDGGALTPGVDPTFLSPQRLLGQPLMPSDDVYALGVMLTELFTAGLPVQFRTWQELCTARLEREPVAPSRLWTEIPKVLEALLLRCLERDPARRYADAKALEQDLDRIRI